MSKRKKVKAKQPVPVAAPFKRPTAPFKPHRVIPLDEVPGLKEAVLKERKNRLLAFFEVSQTVCGFEVMPLTLWRLGLLELHNSPFLSYRVPTPQELMDFLWVMSPEFERRKWWSRAWLRFVFIRRCRATWEPSLRKRWWERKSAWKKSELKKLENASQITEAICKITSQVFQDSPRGGGSGGKSYYHGLIALTSLLASRYSWNERDILSLPVARAFQYARECQERDAIDVALHMQTKYRNPLSNPSDDVTARFCIEEGKKSLNRN
jgi:hypothetical protein